MSDFSSKCREYLKNTGETVYSYLHPQALTVPLCSV
jgi:hypothetical protein